EPGGLMLSELTSLTFAPDGRTLALGGWEGQKVRLWDVATGQEGRTFPGMNLPNRSNVFSSDGRVLASLYPEWGNQGSIVVFWNARTGRRLRSLDAHTVQASAIAFSPDDKLLGTA